MVYESAIRLGSFLAILMAVGVAETVWPKRKLTAPKLRRWIANLSMSIISTSLLRLLLPLVPTGLAFYLANHNWGLFNIVPLPGWMAFILSILLLDMLIYWQHVMFHQHPVLWRVHRMHHIDTDIDASTGIRFHPIEIILSMLLKLGAISMLGPPAIAVLVFEVLLNGCALFNHANIKIPTHVDAILRFIIVTPDQHRVHHSTHPDEFNANYGFNFPWWDRIFKTYVAQPKEGHTGMKIGLNIFRDRKYISIPKLLFIPFL